MTDLRSREARLLDERILNQLAIRRLDEEISRSNRRPTAVSELNEAISQKSRIMMSERDNEHMFDDLSNVLLELSTLVHAKDEVLDPMITAFEK